MTFDFRLGTGFAYRNFNGNSEYGIYSYIEAGYRYYYNLEKRKNKGKNISRNSGNYIALTSLLTNGDPIIGNLKTSIDYYGRVGPVWGFQRTYTSNLNLGLELGLGYGFDNLDEALSTIINFRLGWVLGK